jgi:hypothetical protein
MDEGIFVPITLFIVSGIVLVAWSWLNFRNRSAVMETVQKAMETGSDLSPDLLAKLGAALNPSARDLRRGVVILSIGIAGLLCSFFVPEVAADGVRAGSVFPLLIGAAFLLVWKITKDDL